MSSPAPPAWRADVSLIEPGDPLLRLRDQGLQLGPAPAPRAGQITDDDTDDLVPPDQSDAGGERGLAQRGADHRLALPGEQTARGQVQPGQQAVHVPGDLAGVVRGETSAQGDQEELTEQPDEARRPGQADER